MKIKISQIVSVIKKVIVIVMTVIIIVIIKIFAKVKHYLEWLHFECNHNITDV